MKNRKRCFTIMIVPHSEEATYSFRLPLYVGQLIVGAFVVALAAFLFLAYIYRNVRLEAEEMRILRQVHQVQQDEINTFAHETQQLLDRWGEFEELMDEVTDQADSLGLIKGDKNAEKESSKDTSSEDLRLYAARSNQDRVLDRAAENLSLLQSLLPEKTDDLETLKGEMDEYTRRLAATPSIWPTRGRVSSPFGMRRSPFGGASQFHYGIDIAAPQGTRIYAAADGQISQAGYRGGYGNLIVIRHGYGFQTFYGHLSGFAVSSGQWVKKGQLIGYMGRTGRSTGSHLHYEVRLNGVAVNPSSYMH